MVAATRGRRWIGWGLASIVLCGAWPATAPAATFTNANGITINDSSSDCEADPALAAATPYPSQIDVSGLDGVVTDVNVTLTGVTHGSAFDIRALLVGPTGETTVLMAGAGGNTAINSLNLVIDDEASGPIPTLLTAGGTYQPTIDAPCGDVLQFPFPAPIGPFGEWLDAFDGSAPNGAWSLYVADDYADDSGSIAAWSLDITSQVPDTTAPVTTITSAPAAVSNDTTPRFEFTANEPATFYCAVDSTTAIEDFLPCSSPYDRTLPDGQYTFYVYAVDTVGNEGDWVTHDFVIDSTPGPPVTTITSAPAAVSNDTTPRFEFTANEPATFYCAVDSTTAIEDFLPCSSPYDRTLPDGEYTFYVYAVDTVGNEGDWVTHDFVIDTVAPSVTVQPSAGQDDPTNGSPIDFDVSFSEPVAGFTGSDVVLGGTAGATAATVEGGGDSYVVHVSGMTSDGTVTVSVPAGAAQDEATNPNTASGTSTVTYDTTAPQTTITDGPSGPTNDATPTFTFASSETGSTLHCRIDEGAFYDCDSPTSDTVAALGEGPHTFYVYATDAAGNSEESPDFRQFMVDTTPPTVTINQASGQNDPTNQSPVRFDVVFSEPVTDFTAADVTLTGTAGQGSPTLTGSATTYEVQVPVTSDGTVIAAIPAGGAHDAAGNASTLATSNDRTVTYDITPPTATINQASGQEDPTNDLPIHFDVVFSEPVSDFTAADVSLGGTAAGGSRSFTGSGTTYVVSVSGLTSDGTVIAAIAAGAAHDAAGNASTEATSDDRTVTYDTTPPDTIIDTGPADGSSSPATTATFTFHATEEGSTLRCKLDTNAAAACNTGTVTYTGLAHGSHTFTVVATDRAGNDDPTAATRTFRVNTPPVAVADAYTMISGAPLTVAAPGVLANDTDADGDPITAQLVNTTTRGTLTLNANGSFVYMAGEDAVGNDTFTYRASDSWDLSNTVTVTITVQAGCEGRAATQVGTAGRDTLGGTGGNDVIMALGGNDVIEPGSGVDIVCGGSGNDNIRAGSGNDTVRGGSGNDTLDGGSGNDRLFGEAGIDHLLGGGDDDRLDGGDDAPDLCDGEGGSDIATATCETVQSVP